MLMFEKLYILNQKKKKKKNLVLLLILFIMSLFNVFFQRD